MLKNKYLFIIFNIGNFYLKTVYNKNCILKLKIYKNIFKI